MFQAWVSGISNAVCWFKVYSLRFNVHSWSSFRAQVEVIGTRFVFIYPFLFFFRHSSDPYFVVFCFPWAVLHILSQGLENMTDCIISGLAVYSMERLVYFLARALNM